MSDSDSGVPRPLRCCKRRSVLTDLHGFGRRWQKSRQRIAVLYPSLFALQDPSFRSPDYRVSRNQDQPSQQPSSSPLSASSPTLPLPDYSEPFKPGLSSQAIHLIVALALEGHSVTVYCSGDPGPNAVALETYPIRVRARIVPLWLRSLTTDFLPESICLNLYSFLLALRVLIGTMMLFAWNLFSRSDTEYDLLLLFGTCEIANLLLCRSCKATVFVPDGNFLGVQKFPCTNPILTRFMRRLPASFRPLPHVLLDSESVPLFWRKKFIVHFVAPPLTLMLARPAEPANPAIATFCKGPRYILAVSHSQTEFDELRPSLERFLSKFQDARVLVLSSNESPPSNSERFTTLPFSQTSLEESLQGQVVALVHPNLSCFCLHTAMSKEVPIITTGGSLLRHGANGLLHSPNALSEMWSLPPAARVRMGELAKQKVHTEFSLESYGGKLDELVEELTDHPGT